PASPSRVRGGRQPLLPLRRSSHRRRPATARALSRRRRLVRGEPAPRLVRPRVCRHTAAPPPGATFCAAGRPIGSGSGRRGRSVPGGHPGHPLGNASTEAGGRLAGGTYRSTAPTRCRHRHGPSLWTGKRSEEHTSELQSREKLVCRLLLEKKKETTYVHNP